MLRVCKSGGESRFKSRIFHFKVVLTRTVGHMSGFQTCFAGFSQTHFEGPSYGRCFKRLVMAHPTYWSTLVVEVNQNDLRRCYRLSVEAMVKAVIEKGLYSELEF